MWPSGCAHTVYLLFLFQFYSQRTCRRKNQRISDFWHVLCRRSDAAGHPGDSKQTNFWLLRLQHCCWKMLGEVIWIFLFLVSRKQRTLGCWWAPGVSLQTFNSNIVLTDFGEEFSRGQICKTTISDIQLVIQFFFFFFPRYPSIPPKLGRTTFLLLLFTFLFFFLLFVSPRYVENLEFITFQLTQSYWNLHFVAAPPFWYDFVFRCT